MLHNTSTIRAKCLAEHCAGPENEQGGGGGGGRRNYYHNRVGQGAAPGMFCLGGGGGELPKCLATAARAINFCANPEKVASGCVCVCVLLCVGVGGRLRHIFFPTSKICPKNLHNGVGVLGHDRPLSWQPKKNKQTKTKIIGGGGGECPPPPAARGAATG